MWWKACVRHISHPWSRRREAKITFARKANHASVGLVWETIEGVQTRGADPTVEPSGLAGEAAARASINPSIKVVYRNTDNETKCEHKVVQEQGTVVCYDAVSTPTTFESLITHAHAQDAGKASIRAAVHRPLWPQRANKHTHTHGQFASARTEREGQAGESPSRHFHAIGCRGGYKRDLIRTLRVIHDRIPHQLRHDCRGRERCRRRESIGEGGRRRGEKT